MLCVAGQPTKLQLGLGTGQKVNILVAEHSVTISTAEKVLAGKGGDTPCFGAGESLENQLSDARAALGYRTWNLKVAGGTPGSSMSLWGHFLVRPG